MRSRMALWTAAAAMPWALAAAEPRWIRMSSPHFEIYSSAGAGAARESLLDFEQVRSFFSQLAGHTPAASSPVRIVAFGTAKEYDAVRINEFAQAFYQSTAEHDFIVIGPAAAGTAAAAIHEYVHLVVRHSNLRLPPWLNEGIAELYSALKPVRGKILVGSLIPGRRAALAREEAVTVSGASHPVQITTGQQANLRLGAKRHPLPCASNQSLLCAQRGAGVISEVEALVCVSYSQRFCVWRWPAAQWASGAEASAAECAEASAADMV